MAAPQSLIGQIDLSNSLAANLSTLQRKDEHVTEVIGHSSHVTVYALDERKGMEGSLFVVRRKGHPHFMMMVLNRLGFDHMSQGITQSFKVHRLEDYLMFSCKTPCYFGDKPSPNGHLHGVWFHSPDERDQMQALLERVMQVQNADGVRSGGNGPAPTSSSSSSSQSASEAPDQQRGSQQQQQTQQQQQQQQQRTHTDGNGGSRHQSQQPQPAPPPPQQQHQPPQQPQVRRHNAAQTPASAAAAAVAPPPGLSHPQQAISSRAGVIVDRMSGSSAAASVSTLAAPVVIAPDPLIRTSADAVSSRT
ncbi:unnamed protein product, partial [Ectocarpus sp. 12 AP-2014]